MTAGTATISARLSLPRPLNRIAPGRIRTCNLRFRRPMPENVKPYVEKGLTETTQNDLACFLALLQAKDADLAQVVERWPNLPEHIKAAVKALVGPFKKLDLP